ncbi:MAG TPA: hypothetical protein DDX98_06525 [Bacteroidales bacterium]|nr:hypothetical protein [Bacteroidales bacterium]
MSTVNIYTPNITPRLQYSCGIIFKTILGTDFTITDSQPQSEKADVNYSTETIKGSFQVIPSGLLEQTGLHNHEVNPAELEGLKTLFHGAKDHLGFDIFSAVFYMCSRFEEYLPFESDEHERFKAEHSIAFREGFHDQPIVEKWVQFFANKLNLNYPTDTYKFQLTVDVDDAWMYKHRGFFNSVLQLKLDFFTFKYKRFAERLKVLFGSKKDPWNTFEYIGETEKNLATPVRYFFLLSNKLWFDSKVNIRSTALKNLIAGLWQKNKVGLHPSYLSNFSEKQLHKEFFRMTYMVENKPQHSRQHYLKLKLPETYKRLIKLGVLEDYSMGWASQTGFRTGCSRPVPFYDLLAEKETHLQLVPFMAMDRTLKDYLQLDKDAALEKTKELIDRVKAVGGQFTLLWHNDALSNYGEWEGWRETFEAIIAYASENKKT